MDDLISREAAVRALASSNGDYLDALERFERLPAVDAAPVVHGRWIKYEPDMHGTEPLACSVCDYLFARLYPQNYCPNCGARMDGERRESE